MTVRELIETLECLDDNANVYIGEYQNYGSNFVYTIATVKNRSTIEAFYGKDEEDAVLLIQGNQCGVIGD